MGKNKISRIRAFDVDGNCLFLAPQCKLDMASRKLESIIFPMEIIYSGDLAANTSYFTFFCFYFASTVDFYTRECFI